MKLTYAKVLENALALGKNDRRKLCAQVGQSITSSEKLPTNGTAVKTDDYHDRYEDMTEEEFVAELQRRKEEAERDPSVIISWEEAEAGWRKLLK